MPNCIHFMQVLFQRRLTSMLLENQ